MLNICVETPCVKVHNLLCKSLASQIMLFQSTSHSQELFTDVKLAGISRVKRDTAREGISVAPKERRQNVPRLED